MKNKYPQTSFWILLLVVTCCALPLLIIFGGSSILAFLLGLITRSTLVLSLALLLAVFTIWLFVRKKAL